MAPFVACPDRSISRWNHPDRGLLGPMQFIPLAESTGLIHPLGRWILREACAVATTWPNRLDGERPAISVNMSASQLAHPGIVDDVSSILAETGLFPGKLCIEVTESALLDIEPARAALERLHGLGVYLAVDDFGTGYSALNYLAELPFDTIKVDQSFVGAIGNGRKVDALLGGILSLGDSLELMTVAEGIETEAQLAHLRALGCRLGQGFLFARPMTSAASQSLLNDESGAPDRTRGWSPQIGIPLPLAVAP